jgi:hypothetical protein
MLGFSALFFLGVIYVIIVTVRGTPFDDAQKLSVVVFAGLSGLFLGMYRIVDILEKNFDDN